eukprot:g14928.t1
MLNLSSLKVVVFEPRKKHRRKHQTVRKRHRPFYIRAEDIGPTKQEPTRNSSAESEDEDEDALEGMKEATSSAWQQLSQLSQVAQQRLQEVVRLNALGFYTHSEQLCATAQPSVQRYSIGDVTAFVTNQKVDAGTELCITYIESELLCAPKSLRSQSLNRDFSCSCRACGRADPVVLGGSRRPLAGLHGTAGLATRGGPETGDMPSIRCTSSFRRTFIRVDAQVQARLALLPPQERVEAIDAALEGQMDGEEAEEEKQIPKAQRPCFLEKMPKSFGWFRQSRSCTCADGKKLCRPSLEEGKHMSKKVFRPRFPQNWRRLAAFTCHHCPPYDEALAVYATQAALCALEMKREDAPLYVRLAVEAHRMAFGLECLTWRYQREVEESMVSKEVKEAFWSAVRPNVGPLRSLSEALKDWNFKEEEVPAAYQTFPEEKNGKTDAARSVRDPFTACKTLVFAMAPARPDDSKSAQVTKLSNQISRHFKKCGLRKVEFKKQKSLLIEKELQDGHEPTAKSHKECVHTAAPSFRGGCRDSITAVTWESCNPLCRFTSGVHASGDSSGCMWKAFFPAATEVAEPDGATRGTRTPSSRRAEARRGVLCHPLCSGIAPGTR